MTLLEKLLFLARDIHARKIYPQMRRHVHGTVLDVGGWDFYLTAKRKRFNFDHWTTLEHSPERVLQISDPKFQLVVGDGCQMQFAAESFDTVLNLQVLEHVFEPIRMVQEVGRVLKPNGIAIFLIPQTGTLHMAPHHYYNFTRYWIEEALHRSKLKIIDLKPIGGVWATIGSRMIYFFLQSFRATGRSSEDCKRNALFYILFPFMTLYALLSIPLVLVLSLGDLTEEANNHFVIAKKLL